MNIKSGIPKPAYHKSLLFQTVSVYKKTRGGTLTFVFIVIISFLNYGLVIFIMSIFLKTFLIITEEYEQTIYIWLLGS